MRYSQRKPCSTRCRCSRAASQGKAPEGQCPSGLRSRGNPCPASTILASCLSLSTFHGSNLKCVWSSGISIPSDRQCAPVGQSPALSCLPLFPAAPAQDGWVNGAAQLALPEWISECVTYLDLCSLWKVLLSSWTIVSTWDFSIMKSLQDFLERV